MATQRKILLLTVGYGEGHNTAARAICQEAQSRGWAAVVVDPCQISSPKIFSATQRFYRFCVRCAPWIWGITYSQTETADWSTKAHSPILCKVTRCIKALLEREQPDVVLCTYPLYAYMLDTLRAEEGIATPYGVVVTDSLEISRPWMLSRTDVIYLPDEYSTRLVHDRYALPFDRLVTSGFPVSSRFTGRLSRADTPSPQNLNIVYGAYAQVRRVRADVRALIREFPGTRVTVIAGARQKKLLRLQNEQVSVIERTDDMPSLFENAHLYIGKAGAATVFEAYATHLPLVINYALPGQEQGNLELVLKDGVGRAVASTADLIQQVHYLLENNAALWHSWKNAMAASSRWGGSARIMDDIETRFQYENN